MSKINREIIAEQDIYPPPLITSHPSKKIHGDDRLRFAVWYLQVNRVRTLLCQYVNKEKDAVNPFNTEIDAYKQNLLHTLCSGGIPTNLFYHHHKDKYDRLLFIILTCLPRLTVQALCNQRSYFKQNVVETIFGSYSKYHYVLGLINHGITIEYDDEKTKHCEDEDLLEFLKSKRIKIVTECNYPAGQRFYVYCVDQVCPITNEPFNEPVILTSGHVFEKSAITMWLKQKNVNPLTGKPFSSLILYEFLANKFHHL
jgi:hypothetical protein